MQWTDDEKAPKNFSRIEDQLDLGKLLGEFGNISCLIVFVISEGSTFV